MKITLKKILFTSTLLSATMPSVLFSAEERLPPLFRSKEQLKQEDSYPLSLQKDLAFLTKKPLVTDEADINGQDKNGYRLLQHAVVNDNLEALQLLLQSKADVDREDKCGHTALKTAVFMGNPAVVELLLQHNANINHRDKVNGGTPLTFAHKINKIITTNFSDLKNIGAFDERNSPKILELLDASKNNDE